MSKLKKGRRVVLVILETIIILCLFSISLFLIWASSLKVPDLKVFNERKVVESTEIYDRTGKILLYNINSDIKRTIVPSFEISRHIKNATVAIEDAEFYKHKGIRIKAIVRAIFTNLETGGYSQGGSTITQQVIKNILLTSEKKISRKLKEWILSIKLESILSKDDILTLYLNESPYGGSIYGVEEAAKYFFGKKASEVTLAEAAYLASLPNAPTFYSPYGNNRNKLEERKNLVLSKMKDSGFINNDEYKKALEEKVVFKQKEDMNIKAPHFVMFIRQILEDIYGKERLAQGGFKVISTLDYETQKKAEEIVKRFALENQKKFNASNAAMVVINPKNGDILAMVGSRDYFDKEIDGNFNVTIAKRQPGSAFKPFVYAEAFIKGYQPETVVFDLPTEFSTICNPDGTPKFGDDISKCYMPKNYDGKYRGPVSLRSALAQSLNIPAIKVFYLAGQKDALRLSREMGIKGLDDINRYGLTLVLGGGEVSLLDMTSAYGVFANEGIRNPYRGILKIEKKNNEIEEFELKPEEVLPKNIANKISDILSDNEARKPAFGESSPLNFTDYDVAVKTGTTNDYKDAWVIGYTPNIVVGVWAGNNDNTPMEKKVAGYIVAPMWRAFMDEILPKLPKENFNPPENDTPKDSPPIIRGLWQGGVSYFIEKNSGKRATIYTPEEFKEERVIRDVHSILYWIDKNNPTQKRIDDPNNDPQFVLWESPVRKWAFENGLFDEDYSVIPKQDDPFHRPELFPIVSILNPITNQRYNISDDIKTVVSCVGTFPVLKVEYFFDGVYIGSSDKKPFTITLPKREFGQETNVRLKVVCIDSVGNRGEKEMEVLYTE
jgi:1A family penicillin-binding protein